MENHNLKIDDIMDRVGQIAKASTDKEIAEALGVKQNTLNNWKKIKNRKIPFETLIVFSLNNDINIEWLLTGKGFIRTEKEKGITDFYELKHIDLIKKFKDKKLAVSINESLVDMEELDLESFRDIETYVKAQVDLLKRQKNRKRGDRRKKDEGLPGDIKERRQLA